MINTVGVCVPLPTDELREVPTMQFSSHLAVHPSSHLRRQLAQGTPIATLGESNPVSSWVERRWPTLHIEKYISRYSLSGHLLIETTATYVREKD